MIRCANLIGVLLPIALAGCDQASSLNTMTPSEDEQVARGYIDLLRQNRFEQIEQDLAPDFKTATIHETLVKMAALIPSQNPQSIKVVGADISRSPDFYQSNITLEYQFSTKWLLANVAVQKKAGVSSIIGFNVNPIPDSLENLNQFTLSGKSVLQYVVLALAVFVPLFSLYVLVLCIRTRTEKRKWLWIPFIVLGVGKFAIDWTTGRWSVMPLAVQLFGGGAFAPPYGAWTLSVSLPLWAILFFVRARRSGQTVS